MLMIPRTGHTGDCLIQSDSNQYAPAGGNFACDAATSDDKKETPSVLLIRSKANSPNPVFGQCGFYPFQVSAASGNSFSSARASRQAG
jgi:hypothetical protein